MSIVCKCACGETFEIAEALAGQRVLCGKCQPLDTATVADISDEIVVEMLPDDHVIALADDEVLVLPVSVSPSILHPVALPRTAVVPSRYAELKLKAKPRLAAPVSQAVLQPATQIQVASASGKAVEVANATANSAVDASARNDAEALPAAQSEAPFVATFSPLPPAGYRPPVEEDWSRAAVAPVHNVPRAPIEFRGIKNYLKADRESDDESNLALLLGIVMIVGGLSQIFNPWANAMFWFGGLIVFPLGLIAVVRGLAFRK